MRARAARGELLSPRIYTAGPIVGPIATPEEAVRTVAEQQAAGYDFLKVYDGRWTPEVFDTLMAAATRAKFPVAGHVPTDDSTGVPTATALPMALAVPYRSMEHLHGYWQYLGFRGLTMDSMPPLDEARLRQVAAETKKQAGVWNTPTLAVAGGWGGRGRGEFLNKLVVALHHAGAGLLLGTDTGTCLETGLDNKESPWYAEGPWQIGFSIRPELQRLVRAGLTPYQALETGTRNVAAFFGTLDSTGTVAVGKRADLVLVEGNPLTSFEALAQPAGVMLGGRWLARATLDRAWAAFGISRQDGVTCDPKKRQQRRGNLP